MVAQVGANMLGIIVDRVFDTEEIVVKPVAPILRHVTMFSGNTILGDGSVIMILDPNGIARATGIGASGDSKAVSASAKDQTARSSERTAMLLFRAGSEQKMAVPLGLVARLEDIPRDKIETSCGAPVTQYRGKLMPLVALSGNLDTTKPRQSVLVFTDGDRSMGLMVDEIIDVVEDRLDIELSGARPGLLGTAVIGGHATDVIDTGYWLTQAWQDWFHGAAQSDKRDKTRRVLVVEDSDFFRQLLVPILGAAGYHVTAVPSAAEALRLREAGAMFDVIVSDIEMPDMDGLDFARAVRAGRTLGRAADDRAVGARRPARHRGRARRRLHRLRREIRTRGADRQPAAMPGRTDCGGVTCHRFAMSNLAKHGPIVTQNTNVPTAADHDTGDDA